MTSGQCLVMRQILPILFILAAGTVVGGDSERFPNELNSSVDEPLILLPDTMSKETIRAISLQSPSTEDPLVRLVFDTREAQRRRLLSTSVHTPWQIMHGLLALRHDFIINHENKVVSGLDWVSSGPTFRNEHWFEKTQYGGRAHPYSVPYAFEGHINQFLAILSMSGLSLDHEFGTAKGRITMRDMLTNAQRTVNEKEEITWTLWALSRYLPPDAQWKSSKGEPWSIERLVKLQVDKPLQGAPCGGTHGLFALAHARNVYLRKGEPLRGVWLEAEHKIRKYISTARMQQNPDGTLSSNFFRGREYKEDFDKRMASAGHILEFLMIAMPQEELSEPWIRRAIEATCNDLMKNRHEYVSCSPLYHTVNALSIYLERVTAPAQPANLATGNEKTRTISRPQEIPTADVTAPADSPVSAIPPADSESPPPLTIPSAPAPATPPEPLPNSQSIGESLRLPERTIRAEADRRPMPIEPPELPAAPMPAELESMDDPSTIEASEAPQQSALKAIPMDDDSSPAPAPEPAAERPSELVMFYSVSNRSRTIITDPSTGLGQRLPDGQKPTEPDEDGRRGTNKGNWKATSPDRRRSVIVSQPPIQR